MDAHDTAGAPVDGARGTLTDWVVRVPRNRAAIEAALWLAALLACAADVHTTYVGLQLGLGEGNPFARAAIESAGIGGLVGVKVAAVSLAVLVRVRVPRYGPVIALGLALPWVVAAAVNVATIT